MKTINKKRNYYIKITEFLEYLFGSNKKELAMSNDLNSNLINSKSNYTIVVPTLEENIDSIKQMNKQLKKGRKLDQFNIDVDFKNSWHDVSKVLSKLTNIK